MPAPSVYWADRDPAYVQGQIALGRDVTEYRPDIREGWLMIRQAERALAAGHRRLSDGIIADLLGWNPEVYHYAERMGRIDGGHVFLQYGDVHKPHGPHGVTYDGFSAQRLPLWLRLLSRISR